jgi:hypothetical protein
MYRPACSATRRCRAFAAATWRGHGACSNWNFDADEELAALVIDLADEVRRLRARLHALGIRDT